MTRQIFFDFLLYGCLSVLPQVSDKTLPPNIDHIIFIPSVSGIEMSTKKWDFVKRKAF